MAETSILFQQLGISVLLGLLVGLQREQAERPTAGLRTFPLITVLGTLSAMLALGFGGIWMVAAAWLSLAAVVAAAHLLKFRSRRPDVGTTTDIAMLLMFGVGAFLVVGPMVVAVAIGGGVAVLLQFKPELHGIARQLGQKDLRAIMQFVLITCIILPVLPNRTYGPLDVLNPFETWLMVVFIVGMSLGGYILYKFVGRDAGILLGGVLGGAISSTATTASFGRRARGDAVNARAAAVVIMIASTIVYARVVIEIAVVAPAFLRTTWLPIAVLAALTLLPSLVLWYRVRRQKAQLPEQGNPTQLKSAMVFAVMYAAVLFALAAADKYREQLGAQGIYWVAALSGLTDMDAITLSTARISLEQPEIMAGGWRLLVIASLSNLVFKAAMAGVLGGRRLLGLITGLFAVPLLGGLALLWWL